MEVNTNAKEKRLRWENMRIGDKTGPIQYAITAEVVEAYAQATEDSGEWHVKDSPFGGRIAHPTLNVTDYSLMLFQTFGSHTGMHSHQESEFVNPMKLGDIMTTRGEIVDLFQRRDRDYYVLRYECVNQDGLLVAQNKLTTTVDRDEPPPPAATVDRPVLTPATAAAKETPPVDKGFELPLITREFTRETMALFANQTGVRMGQREPVRNHHTDPELARSVGLPDVVAQSNHYYAWYSEAMLKFLGEGWIHGGRLQAKFFGMVLPGDVITVRGRVSEVMKEEGGERVVVEFSTEKGEGQSVSVATASGFAGRRTPGPGWPIRKAPSLV